MKIEDVAYMSPEELERRGLAPPHYILMLDDNHPVEDPAEKRHTTPPDPQDNPK